MSSNKKVWEGKALTETLKTGGVVVMPTDTIYGIVGQALDKSTIERIYKIKKRPPKKPFIILIGNLLELEKFSIFLKDKQKKVIDKYWPGPTSIIFDISPQFFPELHRDTNTLAIRLPKEESLRKLLLETGPLIAPSANLSGFPPATNTEEARKYFKNLVDLYMDGGEVKGKPSKIIRLGSEGEVSIIRE